jgi:hypothetical protein
MAITLLFHFSQRIFLIKVAQFFKICYHASFQDPKLIYTSVAPTSQVHEPNEMLLLTVGN